ncbi:MAG TPA: hypothetical protein VF546_24540 [Pyrinomonadaceae bacterium]|jgi:hypothetical protein
MNTNVNLEAAVGVLGFLGAGALLLGALLLALCLLARGRRGAAGTVAACAAGLVVAYAGLLLLFALASTERVLARGAEKHFCEIDCHLAYSVVGVRQEQTLGPATKPVSARGVFYVVTVKTRFDEQTIAPRRGDQTLAPNSRVATVLDADGREYEVAPAGRRALELTEGTGMPFTTPLRPGESYTTELVFDLPADVRSPRLLIREGEAVTRLIIGHENSPLHKKTEFELPASAATPPLADE